MRTKRIIALILALLMTVSMFIVSGVAFAEDTVYKDVTNPEHWSYGDIMYVSKHGLMQGKGGGLFAPKDIMTRAEVVTVLYRLSGSPEVNYKSIFKDIPDGEWYTAPVMWAADTKVTEGDGAGRFLPDDPINREQLAAFIYRFADKIDYVNTEEKADITGFADYGKVASYFVDAFAWANHEELIKGSDEGGVVLLDPAGEATREQFAAIIHRYDTAEFDEYKLVYNAPVPISQFSEKDYPLVEDADIYVSPDGSDSNPGTFEKPLATFEGAVTKVRSIDKTGRDGITVAFKKGTYGPVTLNLTSEDSGTAECPVTYCAYGDGDVNFVNGTVIPQDLFGPIDDSDRAYFNDAHEDKIYKADISSLINLSDLSNNSEVLTAEKRLTAAAWPNLDENGTPNYVTYAEYIGEQDSIELIGLAKKKFSEYHTLKGIKFVGKLGFEWHSDILNVESFDPETGILVFSDETFYGIFDPKNNPLGRFKISFRNISEELDVDGEYWIDTVNGVLYTYNKPTTDLTVTTHGLMIESAVTSYLNFVNLNFRGGTGNFVDMRHGSHITFDSCEVFGFGGEDTMWFNHMTNVLVKNCHFYQLAGGCIIIRGGDFKTLTPANNVVTNNLFHDYGQVKRTDSAGVKVYESVKTTVSHNEIYNAPSNAILTTSLCPLTTIEYNYIHNACFDSSDAAPIYRGDSLVAVDNHIRYNIIANCGEGQASAFGIYLDDGDSYQSVYGNILYNSGGTGMMTGGRGLSIRDNVIISTAKDHEAIQVFNKYVTADNYLAMTPEELYVNSRARDLSGLPQEGDPGYEVWSTNYPFLYELHFDQDKKDDPYYVINNAFNTVKNNYAFGQDVYFDIQEECTLEGDIGNNNAYTLDDNPIFVNPAHGNYSIRDDADFADNHFEKIGRHAAD